MFPVKDMATNNRFLFSLVLYISVITSASYVRAVFFPEENHVLLLDEETVKTAAHTLKKLFVMFHAPSCDHCKKAMPEFEKAARKLHKEGFGDIRFAKVDTTRSRGPRDKSMFNFDSVPAIFFVNGEARTMFRGNRKSADFISYIKKKMGMAWETIENVSDLEKLTYEEDVVLLGLFKDDMGHEAEVFKIVATDVDGIPFGMSKSQELFDHFEVNSSFAAVAVKKFDEGINVFDDEWDVDDLTLWSRRQRLPIVIEFSRKKANEIFTGETRQHVALVTRKSSKDFLETYLKFRKIALKYRYDHLFIFIDADVKENEIAVSFFKAGPRDYPAIRAVGFDEKPSLVTIMEAKEVSEENLDRFMKDLRSGRSAKRRGRKFQPEPVSWNMEPLKVLVAGTFYDRIQQHDALVLFYQQSQDCSKCQRLLKIFDDLADEYVWNSHNVMIAKIDGSQNDVDKIEIITYPVIKFFPRGLNIGLDYKGEHSIEAIVKYVDSYSSPIAKPKSPAVETTTKRSEL